jgi:hypothetical protein
VSWRQENGCFFLCFAVKAKETLKKDKKGRG